MLRAYRSIEEARRAFDEFAAVEPKLTPLWYLCRRAAPPARAKDDRDDVYDVDPFEVDVLAADKPEDGWCAEHFFFDHVKSRLMLLVGTYRRTGPPELQTTEAYEAVYALLLEWALNRTCACCAEHDEDRWYPGNDGSPAYQ